MSQFNFKGDLCLSPQQIEFVTEVLQNRGYNNESVTIEPVGKVDDNFIANVKRIIVGKNGNTFNMIAKIAPSIEQVRDAMFTDILFQNENIMYTKVLPKFSALEKEAGVPEAERLMYAECYGTLMDTPNEIILLEDLKVTDFAILDKQKSLTDEEIRCVLKSFAKFHALAYVLRYKDFDDFTAMCGELKNAFLMMQTQTVFGMYIEKLRDELALIIDSNYRDKVTEALTNFVALAVKNSKSDTASKFSVIQQGDSWTNNIMFRFKEGQPVQCCMIDYQNSNQNSPVADLHYMIFNCTDYETRSEHYHDWIDFYHKELGYYLDNFGLKVILVYPRDQLDADLKRLSKVSFTISTMVASMMMKETHENAKMKEVLQESNNIEEIMDMTTISLMENTSMIRFKTRLEGLIKSFIELGYL